MPRIEKFTSLKEFLNSQLAELLPNQDTMIKHHLNLVDYLESETPLFILRKFKNHSNRGSIYSFENHSFTVSDNEPALWVFMETFNQTELDFLDLIENQRFPIAFAIKKEEKQGNVWGTNGRRHRYFSANGWKHCHIFQCSPSGEQIIHKNDLKRRSLRLLSPLNHFPFFSPKKYEMPFDYGENNECIKYVIWWLFNQFYSETNKNIFKNFVENQGFTIPIKEPKDIKIEYSIKNEKKDVTKINEKLKTESKKPLSTKELETVGSQIIEINKTRFFVNQEIYNRLVKQTEYWLKINVKPIKGKHPKGNYLIPNNVAKVFIESKQGGLNWANHSNFHQDSIPRMLQKYFNHL